MYKIFFKIISFFFLLNIIYLLLTPEKRKIKEHLIAAAASWVESTAKSTYESVCTGGKAAIPAVTETTCEGGKKAIKAVPCTPGKELVSPREDAVWQLNDTNKPKSSCVYNFGDYFVPALFDSDMLEDYNDFVKSLD